MAGPSCISQEAGGKNKNKSHVKKLIDAVSECDSEVDNVRAPGNTQHVVIVHHVLDILCLLSES